MCYLLSNLNRYKNEYCLTQKWLRLISRSRFASLWRDVYICPMSLNPWMLIQRNIGRIERKSNRKLDQETETGILVSGDTSQQGRTRTNSVSQNNHTKKADSSIPPCPYMSTISVWINIEALDKRISHQRMSSGRFTTGTGRREGEVWMVQIYAWRKLSCFCIQSKHKRIGRHINGAMGRLTSTECGEVNVDVPSCFITV